MAGHSLEPHEDFSSGFRIREWAVKPRSNGLEGPDGEVRLEPKVMDVLVILARHSGEVVSREEIGMSPSGN